MLEWLKKLIESSPQIASEVPKNDPLEPYLRRVRKWDSSAKLIQMSADYSGYLREAVLIRCGELGAPEFLAPAVARLNDWVPEVRLAAQSTVMTLIRYAPSVVILASLPSVLKLLRAGRASHSDWVAQFEKEVVRLVPPADLIAAIDDADIHVARACFRLLGKYALIELSILVQQTLKQGRDIVLATEAILACSQLPADRALACYRLGLASHFGAVRTAALRGMLELEGEECKRSIAIAALNDPFSSVRERAMSYLKTIAFDLCGYFRSVLQEGTAGIKKKQVALGALAGLRSMDDLALVKSHCDALSPAVRLAALSAWSRLAEKDRDRIAQQALTDPSRRVRKFAWQLVRRGAYLPFPLVRAALRDIDLPLLLQFSDGRKWERLEGIALVSIHCECDPAADKNMLTAALREWIRLAGMLPGDPTTEQLAFFSDPGTITALDRLGASSKSIRFFLDMEFGPKRQGT